MSSRVYEAIIARWDAQSLDDSFPGGIWFSVAPSGAAYPFVQLVSLGNVPVSWTSSSELRAQDVQLSIFYEQTTATDPASALGALMRTLDDAISHAPLSIPASAGHVYGVRRTRDEIRQDPAPGVWHGLLEYRVMRRAPVDYNPS